ncbi:MAG: hypothetical protein JW783_11160 [Bacteroidales bacterium]|nr:hypothetical protein [Bacteroidales bacterium]MBN2748366.1 hypothetical protein [Bacteroidales bacterium]
MKAEILTHNIEQDKAPLFGKTNRFLERIDSLDGKWYVEFFEVKFFFLGIEVYSARKEKVFQVSKKSSSGDDRRSRKMV